MHIAALQFDVRRTEVASNLETVEQGLRQAADQGIELLLLPEMWPTSFVPSAELGPWLSPSRAAVERVRRLSEELGIAVAGSAFEDGGGGQPFNCMTLFDQGRECLSYRKVQLFSLTAEDKAFQGGTELPGSVEWRGWKLAMGICYDLRFPGLWRRAFSEEAEIILVCAQWPVVRIKHWEALMAGRAVEHQAFFLGANRTGVELTGRRQKALEFPGNSLLISPHGEVLARGDGEPGLVGAEFGRDELLALRRTLPVRKDERLAEGL